MSEILQTFLAHLLSARHPAVHGRTSPFLPTPLSQRASAKPGSPGTVLCSGHAQCIGPAASEAVGSPGFGACFPSSPPAQVDAGPLTVGFPTTANLGPKGSINPCTIALGDPGGRKRGRCGVRSDERPTMECSLSSTQKGRGYRMNLGIQTLELFEWEFWRTRLRALNG